MVLYWISGYLPAQLRSGRCLTLLDSGRGAVCLRFGAAKEARALSWRTEEVPRRRKRPAGRRVRGPVCARLEEKAAEEKQEEEGGEGIGARGHLSR